MDVLDRILNTATELFRQYGFKTITMDDIARRSGISKKTLYQQFANKEEVVEAAMKHFHHHAYEACATLEHTSINAVESMVKCTLLMDAMCCKMNPLALLELRRFYPVVFAKVENELITETIDLFRQNLERGIAEGLYRPGLNVALLAHYRIAVMRMLNETETPLSTKYPPREVNQALSEHFLYGLLTPKGEKQYLKYKATYQQQVSEL